MKAMSDPSRYPADLIAERDALKAQVKEMQEYIEASKFAGGACFRAMQEVVPLQQENEALKAEVVRLHNFIENAPHNSDCSTTLNKDIPTKHFKYRCDCWKSRALQVTREK